MTKRHRKYWAILLFFTVIAVVFLPLSAAMGQGTGIIVADDISAAPGEQVEIVVRLEQNSGLSAFLIYVQLDSAIADIPTLAIAASGAKLGDFSTEGTLMANTYGQNGVQVSWFNVRDVKTDGTLFRIPLTILDNTPPGSYDITVTCSPKNTINAAEEKIALQTVNGVIRIEGDGAKSAGENPSNTGTNKPSSTNTNDPDGGNTQISGATAGGSVGAGSSANTSPTVSVNAEQVSVNYSYQPMQPAHIAGTRVEATKTNNPLFLAGERTDFPAVKISGYNWLKLRDFAMLLNGTDKQFSVTYDATAGIIDIRTGQVYQPLGDELSDMLAATETAIATPQRLRVNGEFIEVAAYNINGYNYFRLRDLAIILDFAVIYDEATGQITLDFANPYRE